ncbi:MAG: anti-sigma factor [Actinomycetota bacterium]|nr:hypothetical protein [Actinomycetota bacterium]
MGDKMQGHLDPETLNALADDAERLDVEAAARQHLQTCQTCSASVASLKQVIRSLHEMPEIQMTVDEHRTLRQGLIASRGTRRPALLWRWGLAGISALLVVALAGTFIARTNGGRGAGNASSSLSASAPVLDLKDESEVRNNLMGASDVTRGAKQYQVKDVAPIDPQNEAPPASAQTGDTAQREATTSNKTSSPQAAFEYSPVSEYPPSSDILCKNEVRRSQPYPTIALPPRKARFKNQPAWLLVYLFSPTNGDNDRLDHVQYWLIPPVYCGDHPESHALSYGSFIVK